MEFVGTINDSNDSNDNHCTPSPCPDLLVNSISKDTTEDSNDSKNNKQEKTSSIEEHIDFKVIYNKQKIDVTFPASGTVHDLKVHLEKIISVPYAMQKVMIKGLAKDDQMLKNLGVTNGAKVMIVGSQLKDVLSMTVPSKQELTEEAIAATNNEPLSKQKIHRKVLDKGVPEDAMPGILNSHDSLPNFPLSGMLNKSGGKVRLTFKLELDQLWLGTKERTEKLNMTSIKGVHTEAIHDHPEYHIVGLQLGTTEASRYWIYWVPAQFVTALKDTILGKTYF